MTLSTTLGHCRRIGATVTDWQCLSCFISPDSLGLSRRTTYGLRMRCVEANIQDPPMPPPLTGEDLNALSETSLRHIIGNATMIAQANPHEATAQTLLREIRLHLAQGQRTGGP